MLGACSMFERQAVIRGNMVDPDLLRELTPGTSTRADATALLGSPTAHASFDDNTWIYIGERTRPVIAGTNAVLTQKVIVLTFDQSGVLRDIHRLSGDDSLPVTVVDRTTPSPGSSSSILQQLLGNVGKFNPAGIGDTGGSGQIPTGGSPTQ